MKNSKTCFLPEKPGQTSILHYIYIMNRNFHIGFKFFKRRIILTSEIVVIYKYDLIASFFGGKGWFISMN